MNPNKVPYQQINLYVQQQTICLAFAEDKSSDGRLPDLGCAFPLGLFLFNDGGSRVLIGLLVTRCQAHRRALDIHLTPSEKHASLRGVKLVLFRTNFAGDHA